MPNTSPKPAPPGRADVVQLVGDVDDAVVAAILGTGASHADIEQAVLWAEGDEPLGSAARTLHPQAAEVYDILISDPTFLPPVDELRQ